MSGTTSTPADLQSQIDSLKAKLSLLESAQATTATVSAPRTIPKTKAEKLGISRLLTSDRTDAESESIQVLYTADQRLKFSTSDRAEVKEKFVKGLKAKVKALKTLNAINNITSIQGVLDFSKVLDLFESHFSEISAQDVMHVLQFKADGSVEDPDAVDTPSLFSGKLPSLADVEKSARFWLCRGDDVQIENLKWGYDAIHNSCDAALQRILNDKMQKYDRNLRVAPLLFYYLVDQFTNVTDKSIRTIIDQLSGLSVLQFDGQSIPKTTATIRAVKKWLTMVDHVPKDLPTLVLKILKTCTVQEFSQFISSYEHVLLIQKNSVDMDDLMDQCESMYRDMVLDTRWDAVGHQGSAFSGKLERKLHPHSADGSKNSNAHSRKAKFPPRPGPNDPHELMYNDKLFKFCTKCNKWFFGDLAHLTDEHIDGVHNQKKKPPTPKTTPQANSVVPTKPKLARTYLFTGGL